MMIGFLAGWPQTRPQRPAEEQDQTQWTTSKELLSLYIAFGLGQLVVLYEVSPVVDDGVEEH